ncbi:MAG: S8 family serine peptidase, partial [Verrucomicrobiales bacterium]|nr:S8 family serine peptidase [Verrucomicrobiales bacterium]
MQTTNDPWPRRSAPSARLCWLWWLGLIAAAPGVLAQIPGPDANAKLTHPTEIHRRFTNGQVEVIVTLAPPLQPAAANLRSPAVRAQVRAQMRAAQQAVLDALPAAHVLVRHRFDNLAAFTVRVSTNGLRALQAHPAVQAIEPVVELEPHLAQGIPLIRGMTFRSTYSGQGVAIAICDTGVDYTHPRLGGGGFPNAKVIGGYDFGDNDPDPMPIAQAHGTACAGIAAGDLGTVGDYIGGVAPAAKIYALKISAGSTGTATSSAMAAAWDWCVTHRDDDPNNPLLVISTSFGGGRYFSACDSASPAMTAAANNAVAAGITVLASSGNDGFCDSLSWPSCISSVISVGAVYDAAFGNFLPCVSADSCAPKISTSGCSSGWYVNDSTAADKVTAYANVASFLTLFAPANQCYTLDIVGSSGYSSGDYFGSFGGTSAACPYAAGAVAALQSAAKTLTGNFLSPATVKTILLNTGDNVTDTKVAITKPRVNLERAIQSLGTNALTFISATLVGGNGNQTLDANECVQLAVAIRNNSTATATNVVGTLVSSAPGLTVTEAV